RFSKPVPEGEVPATYGIPQKPKAGPKAEATAGKEKTQEKAEEPATEELVENKQPQNEESQQKIES
ncbi:MAG TPA: hypothetical protein VKB35_17830, partial [Ktedonobacteraceae bacterium]|nr:hypothetical protein [Ktedonobacteraceae bacterium]